MNCCASKEPDRAPPAGLHVVRNFLSSADCNSFIRFAEKQKKVWLPAYRTQFEAEGSSGKRDSSRKTQTVTLGKREANVTEWIRQAVVEHLEKTARCRIDFFEAPYVLRYGQGGTFAMHSDSEGYNTETEQWSKVFNRDWSLLAYLNDDYTGGELYFPYLNYAYKPQKGDLAFFPSGYIHCHESRPITSGVKLAVVSFAAEVQFGNAAANLRSVPNVIKR